METNYIAEAFQKLSLLEDDFNFSVGPEAADDLRSYMADDVDVPTEEPIIDVAAETAEDLQDTYVGKVILECSCCHTRIYKDLAEVFIDDETGFANPDEECPVCHTKSGYNVVGKIEEYTKAEEHVEEKPAEEIPENDDFSEEELAEAFKELKEGYRKTSIHDTDDVPLEEAITEVSVKTNDGEATVQAEEAGKVTVDLTEDGMEENEPEEAIIPLESDDIETIETNEAPIEDETGMPIEEPVEEPIEAPMGEEPLEELPTEETQEEEPSEEPEEEPSEEVEESLQESRLTEAKLTADEFKKRLLAKFGNGIDESKEDCTDCIEENIEDKETFAQRLRRKYGAQLGEAKSFEKSMDQLVESYLRRVYGNVSSYYTNSVNNTDNGLIVEGIISFESGKQKPTKFVFESKSKTAKGSIIYKGLNEMFSNSKKAFTLRGSEVDGKFIPESMLYNYNTKTLNESNESETIKVSGRVVAR